MWGYVACKAMWCSHDTRFVCGGEDYVAHVLCLIYVRTYIHTVPWCSTHRLGRDVCGRVKFANLADGFVEKPLEQFSVGDVVKAKVLE